jgi:ribosomal protein S18 acetylase RimI-like enzyme
MTRRREVQSNTEVVEQTTEIAQVTPQLDLIYEEDSMACSCDHRTFVAKLADEPDETGSIPMITVAKVCVKKKTWFLTEVKHLIVREEFRRRGIAKQIVNHILDTFNITEGTDEDKVIITSLVGGTVNVENEATINLLTSMGFVIATSFINNKTNSELYFLVKSLTGVRS